MVYVEIPVGVAIGAGSASRISLLRLLDSEAAFLYVGSLVKADIGGCTTRNQRRQLWFLLG